MENVMQGIIDMHIHAAPDVRARKLDDLELMEASVQRGVRAIVLKSHNVPTADRAYLVNRVAAEKYPDAKFTAFGGLCLNRPVGGLNPDAVETSLKLGAKVIWLPTLDSVHERKAMGKSGGIVCTQDGRTVDALDQVLKAVADTGMVLATGHIAWQEQLIAVKRAKELGVEKIIVNHPALFRTGMPVDAQKALLEYDGVYLERNYGGSRLPESKVFERHFEKNLADILATGVERSIMATDLGQPNNPGWSDGFAEYIDYMRTHGLTDAQIKAMIQTNPKTLLGLD